MLNSKTPTCALPPQNATTEQETRLVSLIPTAQEILAVCGYGKILNIGSGKGELVRELLAQGVDAIGLDGSAPDIEYCNRLAPGRFFWGSILELPFHGDSFDTVICADYLEHLEPENIPLALGELHRICRRNVYLRVSTSLNKGGRHLAIAGRDWWEQQAFVAGFRKHPRYYEVNPFESLETDGLVITIVLEKIPAAAFALYPLTALKKERDLHMDMLRETGRRSDAHLHRYMLACQLVRPADRVLDAACGLGYGSYVIATRTLASEVIGLDLSDFAVTYSRANFSTTNRHLKFKQADVQNLKFLPDKSFDLIISYETLEHIPKPKALLNEIRRLLKPGGRVIASVPNRWDDGTGHDPSPFHLHVYDWERLQTEFRNLFLIEKGYGETAGGGMRLTENRRDSFFFDPVLGPERDSEWLLIQAMADPLAYEGVLFKDLMYADEERPNNLIEYARDYINPFLPHAMVSLPWRMADPRGLHNLADRVLESYPTTSPDYGAALCVLSYRQLENPETLADSLKPWLKRIQQFQTIHSNNTHVLRWKVSTAYVAGLLCLKVGDRETAMHWFEQCFELDFMAFTPVLCTKMLASGWHLSRLYLGEARKPESLQVLNRALDRFFEALECGRGRILGNAERPFDFPFFELTEAITLATNCVNLARQLTTEHDQSFLGLPVENLQSTIAKRDKTIQDLQVQLRTAASRGWHEYAPGLALRLAKDYQQGDRVVIFGVGQLGCDVAALLHQADIPVWSFIDNSSKYWGTEVTGIYVRAPAEAIQPYMRIAIASTVHTTAMSADVERLAGEGPVYLYFPDSPGISVGQSFSNCLP